MLMGPTSSRQALDIMPNPMNPSTWTTCFPTGQLSVFISVDSQLAVRCHRKSTACSVMPETAAPAEEPTHKSYSYTGFEKLSCGSAMTLMSKVTALKPCLDNPKSATTLMSKVTALNPCFDNPKATPTKWPGRL